MNNNQNQNEIKLEFQNILNNLNNYQLMPNSKKIDSIELVEEVDLIPATNLNQVGELCRVLKATGDNLIQVIEDLSSNIKNSQYPKIYFTKDLCKIYNVDKNTIYNYRKAGILNYCSVGQRVWFTQEHIDEFNQRTDSRYKAKLQKVG